MTNKDALDKIINRFDIMDYCESEVLSDALNNAIEALEKQIPKKPKRYIAFDGIERNGCPTCPKNEILYAGQKYCSVCGQKIVQKGEGK